jgi:RsiW-degrading membrane proteinase PrsW (M82 family)
VAAEPVPARPGRRLPRWKCQASLFQPREPAFWLYVVLLAGTGLLAVAQQRSLREMAPSGWALSWLLLALYLVPVLLVVYLLDAYEREPPSLVAGALLWGAVAATSLSGLANHDWGAVVARVGGPDLAAQWTAALTAPWVEETLKAVGVVLIYLIARSEINGLVDGFVYGAIVGLGFAVVENVFYFVAQFGGTPAGVLGGFFVRVLASGLYGHVLYSGLTGMGIAWFVTRPDLRPARRLLVAGALCLLAVLAHFLWNSPLLNLFPTGELSPVEQLVAIPLAAAVKGIPLLVLVVLLVTLARRQERRWLQAAAVGELGGPALAPEELEVLERPGRRWRARRALRRRAGRRAAGLLRRLQRQQLSLAMLRTRLEDDDAPDLVHQRQRIIQTRQALQAAVAASRKGNAAV